MAKAKTEVKTEEVKSKGVDPGLVKNQLDGDYDFTDKEFYSAVIRFGANCIMTIDVDLHNFSITGELINELEGQSWPWYAEENS